MSSEANSKSQASRKDTEKPGFLPVVCLNLRSKEMFYADDDAETAEHRREVERLYGACDTAAYWCQCTQTGRGPDGQPVAREVCSQATRKCFESVESLT